MGGSRESRKTKRISQKERAGGGATALCSSRRQNYSPLWLFAQRNYSNEKKTKSRRKRGMSSWNPSEMWVPTVLGGHGREQLHLGPSSFAPLWPRPLPSDWSPPKS